MNQEYYSSSNSLNSSQMLYGAPTEAWQSSYVPYNMSSTNSSGMEHPCVTPVSTATYGTTCSWAHTVPSLMPWVPKKDTSVVRFSAAHFDPCSSQAATCWEKQEHHLKRKTDLDEDTPHKVCITEEKMAARFRDMHISNQFTIPSESAPSSANKSPTNLQQLEIMLNDSDSSDAKSLILAPEIKKLVEPEKILNTFLNKIEKPSMALVVWQPPNTKIMDKQRDEASDAKTNNNLTPQQLSLMCQQYLSSSQESVLSQAEDVMEI